MPRAAAWWKRRSLQARVTIAAAAVVTLGLAAASAVLVLTLRSTLFGGIEETAGERAQEIAVLIEQGRLTNPLQITGGENSLAQVVTSTGQVLAASPELQGAAAWYPISPRHLQRQPQVVGDVAVGEDSYRVIALTDGPAHAPVAVYVATSTGNVTDAIRSLTAILLVGLPVLVALLAVVVFVLVRYTLNTVGRMRRQVGEISATDLHRRIGLPDGRDELRALALTMNQMLDRLEGAATAQRRFLADAAHELRSPLAALRTQLEVALRQRDAARWLRVGPDLLTDAERLGRLVDDLLALARLEEPASRHQSQLVDLDEVVFSEVRRARHTSRVPIHIQHVSAALAAGDPDLLTRVVRNLLDNAIRHAHARVDVALGPGPAGIELVVSDDGPGVPAADQDRIFERFTRLDSARSRDTGGTGLGLAIVRQAVAAHAGEISVVDNSPGARFVVRLPTADPAPGPPPPSHASDARPEPDAPDR